MLAVISPAKSLDLTSRPTTRKHSQPRLLDESQALTDVMRTKAPDEIADLMHVSDDIAELNAQRYRDFELPFTTRNARPAAFLFNGDTYQGLNARERFDERDWTEASKTLRILSGLYGVLRPLDLIQPYRLEMGLPLANERGSSLYAYWGSTITDLLRADLAESPGASAVLNLASEEYAKSVRFGELDCPVISPRFEDTNARGTRSVVSFYAKRARGMLASWLVRERVRTPGAVKRFAEQGYRYDPDASTAQQPVFVRSFEERPAVGR